MPQAAWSRRSFNKAVASLAAVSTASSLSLGRRAIAASAETLKVRILSEPVVLDPAFWQSSADVWIMEALLPKLAIFKPGKTWQWEPYAAKKLDHIDDRTVAFELIEGIKWSGGFGDVTAEDVKYSFERFLDQKLQSPIAGNWALLDHVEITGTYAGKIHLKKPFAGLWTYVLPYDPGHIVCKKAVEAAGGKYGLTPPATAGAFRLVEYVPQQKLVLEPNPDWPLVKPNVKRIEALPITDAKAAENAVISVSYTHLTLPTIYSV